MIEFSETNITNLILHKISNEAGNCMVNDSEYNLGESEEEITLKKIFLKPFTAAAATYEFSHEINLDLNPLYKLSAAIFDNEDFTETSKNIHQHLKSVSKHPNIKDGDLFILKYKNLKMNNKFYEALGIYKVENKESFVETIFTGAGEIKLQFKKGIGTRKLDKACLIVFTEIPYTVLIIDNAPVETDYWMNEFIRAGLKNDNINSTNHFLTLTKSYITGQLPDEYNVPKTTQIDLLNRSVEYFKNHETFEKEEFENEIFHDNGIIDSFRKFDETYREKNDLKSLENFVISTQAVKKQARVFKSVLKLDKNFHIYIHGDRELIEQGTDQDGRKFYKIYYQEEL